MGSYKGYKEPALGVPPRGLGRVRGLGSTWRVRGT